MKLTRRTTVLAATEATPGVDPGTGYQAILTREGTQINVQGEVVTRDALRDTLSPRGHVIGLKQVDLTIPVELRAGGLNAGLLQAPEVDPLLLACALQQSAGSVITLTGVSGTFVLGETVTNATAEEAVGTVIDQAGNTLYVHALQNAPAEGDSLTGAISGASATVDSVADALVYRPVSDPQAMQTAAVRYYLDGIRHLVLGARGTLSMNLQVGQIPELTFTVTGLYAGPIDDVPGAVSYSTVTPHPVFGAQVQLGDTDLSGISINAISFDLANTVTPDDDVQAETGRRGFDITARDPNGSIDPSVVKLADFNPWADWESATPRKIACAIGKKDGERIRFVAPRGIYREPSYQDRNGRAAYSLTFGATGSDAGDDEVFLIVW